MKLIHFWLALGVGFVGLVSPTFGQKAPHCSHWAAMLGYAHSQHWRVGEITGADKGNFLANYNRIPPPSNDHPDHLYAIMEGDDVAIVFVTANACVTKAELASYATFMEILTTPAPGA